jgi:hypothetical protein
MKFFWMLISFLSISSQLSSAQTKTLTICEVLSDIATYRSKMISVRGIVFSGYHGSGLADHEQRECPGLSKSGRQWPSSIYLTWPGENPEDGSPGFVPDSTEIKQTLSEVNKAVEEDRLQGGHSLTYVATFIGELRSRKDIRIIMNEDGSYSGNGYGQLGRYPASLVIKSVVAPQLIDLTNWKRK